MEINTLSAKKTDCAGFLAYLKNPIDYQNFLKKIPENSPETTCFYC